VGLFLYDNLGGRKILPGTSKLDLRNSIEGAPLQDRFEKAYEYSDCWVEDSRLVVLNARDAAERGATIMTRTRVLEAVRAGDHWRITLQKGNARREVRAKMLVNAGGPWVGDIIRQTVRSNSTEGVRLVRGSHIVTRKLFDHGKCYFFQGTDGRIIFAIPYETDFTLIGTTDQEHPDASQKPVCTAEERKYLADFASQYFKSPVTEADIVWTYSGVRPLYDDGASSATAATREYVLKVDGDEAPLLNVFGGKITTYRRLAEAALAKIVPFFPNASGPWTAGVPLAGGDFPVDGFDDLVAGLQADYPFLTPFWARRLVRAYGTEARAMLGDARTAEDLGEDFGATVTARELDRAMDVEWVQSAEDFVWRRTKLGLRLDAAQIDRIDGYIQGRRAAA
jgi:glycerol-3-phosphate dehydrogenase